jgi:ribosomal protein L30
MASGKKVTVIQVRSAASRAMKVDRQLQAMGLGRVGKKVTFALNPATQGMIHTVRHLVKVEEAK